MFSQDDDYMVRPYVLTMTELQCGFYHALLAPFHPHELSEVTGRGPKALTYVDKRAIENRLDTVCGPDGWYPRYKSAEAGLIICSLSIFVPGPYAKLPASEGNGWHWITKEDGAGYEGMVKKVSGEVVRDDDNDSKSAVTNALRRVAQDAWGIGRYLYRKGVPGWLDPNNSPLNPEPVKTVGDPLEKNGLTPGDAAREAARRYRDVAFPIRLFPAPRSSATDRSKGSLPATAESLLFQHRGRSWFPRQTPWRQRNHRPTCSPSTCPATAGASLVGRRRWRECSTNG